MSKIWTDRRTWIATLALACLTFLGYTKGMDVMIHIATIAVSVAAANAWEKKSNANPIA